MSKNKIIFLILWFFVLLFLIFIFLTLNSNKVKNKDSSVKNAFTIWIYQDDSVKFWDFLKDFQEKNTQYKEKNFNIVSFNDYEDYFNTLVWAFLNWKWPDMFVLNNWDSKFFDNQISWIESSVVDTSTFRNNYEVVFSNELIETRDVDWKSVEYLRWVPLWYEILWMFYNFRELKWKNLKTWWYINDAIKELSSIKTPVIWLWNGSTVYDIADIITQFFVQDWFKNLNDLTINNAKNPLWRYFLFWDSKFDNKYDNSFQQLVSTSKNNLDMFSSWELEMVIWYPRMLEEINKRWYGKSFLRATTFPSYSEDKSSMLVNYNYFVVSKNTTNYDLSMSLIKYFASPEWQKKYLETFPYYFPSMISLLKDRLEENISKDYVIKYKDFYNSSFDLVTFDKSNKYIYDKDIVNILDNSTNSQELFENFRKKVLCIWNKMLWQWDMSASCK